MINSIFDNAYNEILDKIIDDLKANGKSDKYIADMLSVTFLSELQQSIHKNLVIDLIEYLKSNVAITYSEYKEKKSHFNNHIYSIWGKGYCHLNLFKDMVTDVVGAHNKLLIKNHKGNITNKQHALFLCYCRSMQLFSEIICLLENGFADGAMILYRALFELWAVFIFIYDDEEIIAKNFLDSYNKESLGQSHYKWAEQSKKFKQKNQEIGISAIITQAFNIKNRNINSLNKNMFKSTYNFSNLFVHPSARGIVSRLQTKKQSLIPIGNSVYGIKTPAINSSIIMYNISSDFLLIERNMNSLTWILTMRKFLDITQKIFIDIDKKL